MPVPSDNNMSFLTFCAFWHIPGWRQVLDLEVPERIKRLRDPEVRADLLRQALPTMWATFVDFSGYTIGDVFSEENEACRNRKVGDIATERGQDPFTTIVEIAAADQLQTVLWPPPFADTDADWQLRRTVWDDPDILIGGSDAGAHLDRLLGSPYPTRFLADSLRGRQLVTMERAVQLMTDVPARLFGLRNRGRLAVGYRADVVVFDPETVGAGPSRTCYDLPGQGKRLVADPLGMAWVLVNGRQTLEDGQPTGDLAGTLLRSGRDTSAAAR
jgi:N-acyl-D-aspartate/D-glutamate deacylase